MYFHTSTRGACDVKTILVVDDEKMILRLATEALESYGEGYNVITALNGKQALQALASTGIELVLTDLKMPVMDGYELLSFMSKNYRDIPVIVMTGFGSPEIAKRLRQKGILYYIEKPFEISALRDKITDVFTAKSKGYIHGFTLANFLQTVEVEQKTTTLRVSCKGRVGYLHLENGDLLDAEAGGLRGERAAIEVLCWDNAEIEIQPFQLRKKTIENSLMHILLEASKIKDEKGAVVSHKEDPIDDAIQFAEGHQFKKAQEIIVKYLKTNPRSAKAWLWYSRIIVTMKPIEASLSNALKLAPKNPEVLEEAKKIRLAKQNLQPDAQIRRCPFCWCPMEVRTVQCPYCKTLLFIHSETFRSLGSADRKILEEAIERYMKVIGRENNVNAMYFLGIAHLNMEHWEEALNLFHKTVKLAPDKKIFSEQLRLLLNHMAMDSTTSAFEMQVAKREQELEKEQEDQSPASAPAKESDIPVKKKILVVEDSSTTRKVIAITLAQKGYDIIEAKDGLEALSRLNEEKPDLVLLDIILPKMDGYKILSIIKGNAVFKDIPVIMLTSRDSFMHKVKGRLAGSSAYLTKPFDPKVLVDTIEKHL